MSESGRPDDGTDTPPGGSHPATPPAARPPQPQQDPPPPPGRPQREPGESLGHFFLKVLITTVTVPVTLALLFVLLGISIAVVGAGVQAGGLLEPTLQTEYVEGPEGTGEALLSVPIEGVILGEELADPFGFDVFVNGYDVKEALEQAAEDDTIKGVILEVSSPGGTIYGSRAIAEGVQAVQAAGKPATAFVRGLSASGAVFATAPADVIWADHGSLVGSIGVIAGPITFYDQPVALDGGILGGGVVTNNGIEQRFITAGEGKDFGNPFRRLTDKEVRVLQEGIDDEYDNFVAFVSEHRDIPREEIVDELGALVYGNEQAERGGLIDGTRNRDEARDETAKLADLPADYELRTLVADVGLLGSLLGSVIDAPSTTGAGGCPLISQTLVFHGDPLSLCTPVDRG